MIAIFQKLQYNKVASTIIMPLLDLQDNYQQKLQAKKTGPEGPVLMHCGMT
jgi:hypothetical protein